MAEFSASCACSVKCGCGLSRLLSCLSQRSKRKDVGTQTDEELTGKLIGSKGFGDRTMARQDAKRIAPPPPPPSRIMPMHNSQQQDSKSTRACAFAPTKEELISSRASLRPVCKTANKSNSDCIPASATSPNPGDKGPPIVSKNIPNRSFSEPAANTVSTNSCKTT